MHSAYVRPAGAVGLRSGSARPPWLIRLKGHSVHDAPDRSEAPES